MIAERTAAVAGCELALLEAGVGGRPLLLVHGYTGSKEDFGDWVLPLAAEGWHVVVPDLRGHGDSEKPHGDASYSLSTLAADLDALVDVLGWDRFALLGHSMGGMLAQLLALPTPDRLDALILMDTHHGALETIDPDLVVLGAELARTAGMDAIADALAALDSPLDTAASLAFAAANPAWGAFTEQRLRSCSPHMYATLLEEITSTADRLEQLAALRVATLVIVGAQDEPFLEPSRAMAATIVGAQLVVVPEAGHSPQLEAPEAWWASVSGFLRSVVS